MSFIPRRIFPDFNIPLSNFKGHHQKALTKFGHLAPQIDMVLEVRDSRAPVATTNVLFDRVLANKPKLILYSKKDLSVLKTEMLDRWHKATNEQYMFIDCRNKRDASLIIDVLRNKYDAMHPRPPLGLRLMIIGMPNVGKSSLVNTLRAVGYTSKLPDMVSSKKTRKVARTGGQPGVTRATSEIIRLSEDPDILVYDTPGVFLPTVKDTQTMLALGLVGCVHTSFIDPVIQADYLLFLLNLQDPSGGKYKEYIDHPTNNINELLYHIAKTRGTLKPNGWYDEIGLANHWILLWKQGKGSQYKGLFEIETIVETNGKELQQLFLAERERLRATSLGEKITDKLGEDGTGRSKQRKRTAKDREMDSKNLLFKL